MTPPIMPPATNASAPIPNPGSANSAATHSGPTHSGPADSGPAPLPACEIRHLSVTYGADPVLRGVDLSIRPGVVMGIVGPNGAGKSTLISAMLGLVPPVTGEVRFFGQPLNSVRARVGYMPQSTALDWDFPTSVRNVVTMGTYGRLGWFRRPGRVQRERVERALAQTGISGLADRQIGELSGGQQQRVLLARMLAQDADLCIMDEPFQGVDAQSQHAIVNVLHDLRAAGSTVMIVHHDLTAVRATCDEVTLLNRRVIASGPVDDVLTDAHLRVAYDAESDPAWTGPLA